VRYQRGDEAIRWANGSLHGITAPGEKSGHSEVLDLAVVDEAWALEDARLEQGLSPTMITRPQPQLWVVSAAGTHRSGYLRGKVNAGRARAGAGQRSTVAYFEWSALAGSDPGDPATWWACMPALGHTVTEARIAAEFERLDLADFCRAYLNWWPSEIPADWLVITEADWRALVDPDSAAVDPVAFAADVTPERSHAAIAVAGLRPDGLGHAEVVDHRPGIGWVIGRLVELHERWQPCAVVVDDTGPAGSLVAPLEAAGLEVIRPTTRARAAADGGFYDAVAEQSLRYVPRPALDAAMAGAATRPLGDAWAWARKGLSTDITPLVAVSLARWGHATGRTCTTANRASTCERATTPEARLFPAPGVVGRAMLLLGSPARRADGRLLSGEGKSKGTSGCEPGAPGHRLTRNASDAAAVTDAQTDTPAIARRRPAGVSGVSVPARTAQH
jgi:Phage Terminase